jgi:hypothetical protein
LNGTRLGESSVEMTVWTSDSKERRVGDWCAWHIKKELGWGHARIGHGAPDARRRTDINRPHSGRALGVAAADYANEGRFGVMAALKGQDIVPFPLEQLTDDNGKSITRNIPDEYIEFGRIIMK